MLGLVLGILGTLVFVAGPATAADANRLAYLDDPCNPYYVGLGAARLTTPQWIGDEGVEAVVVLSIDDMTDPAPYEECLRPIIERLKQIDGRGPVSIMTKHTDPADPQLQRWLKEGVTVEAHTYDHPCPCLHSGDFAAAKATYDRSIDVLKTIPGGRTLAFRMPCCDSMNSVSPRFFAEMFNRCTPAGNFLRLDSSVFTVYTCNDPALPSALLLDDQRRPRFAKYVPVDRKFVNLIESYPYPYVIGRLCWEIPSAVPDDWQGYNLRGACKAETVADMKAAIDATVIKQGQFTLTFHPHRWIKPGQVVELIDHATNRHGNRVKFLNFQDVYQRLTANVTAGHPLRNDRGGDNGVRILDVNADGFMDAVVANDELQQTRIWVPEESRWQTVGFPVKLVAGTPEAAAKVPAGVRFAVLQRSGYASVLKRDGNTAGLWHFDGRRWVEDAAGLDGLVLDGGPVQTAAGGQDLGVRLLDLNDDGICELLVGNPAQNAIFRWQGKGHGWKRLPIGLPEGIRIVTADGGDAGLRLVDLDADGRPDVVFSSHERYRVHLFESLDEGWSSPTIAGCREPAGRSSSSGQSGTASGLPPIVRRDGSLGGVWFKDRHLWVQNERTGKQTPFHIDSRSYRQLLGR